MTHFKNCVLLLYQLQAIESKVKRIHKIINADVLPCKCSKLKTDTIDIDTTHEMKIRNMTLMKSIERNAYCEGAKKKSLKTLFDSYLCDSNRSTAAFTSPNVAVSAAMKQEVNVDDKLYSGYLFSF